MGNVSPQTGYKSVQPPFLRNRHRTGLHSEHPPNPKLRIPASLLRQGLHQQCPRTIFQGQRGNTQRKDVIRHAALDRKITAELAPKHDEKDGEEVKREEHSQQSQQVETLVQSVDSKESIVAEPVSRYQSPSIMKRLTIHA